eukprot:TRINITY_DN13979_c0_g2_i2.p1 TRINITY_DN13979_c0_g2~~TRINITY_DN13979_c0_g2_i2.p1  ORF type:complete len:117 (+),score=28.62 TRINITY_DN13979_c0_g2_i2:29-352(+)
MSARQALTNMQLKMRELSVQLESSSKQAAKSLKMVSSSDLALSTAPRRAATSSATTAATTAAPSPPLPTTPTATTAAIATTAAAIATANHTRTPCLKLTNFLLLINR